VDVAVNPQRGFIGSRAGLKMGDGQRPDVAPLIAFAHALDFDERGVFGGVSV